MPQARHAMAQTSQMMAKTAAASSKTIASPINTGGRIIKAAVICFMGAKCNDGFTGAAPGISRRNQNVIATARGVMVKVMLFHRCNLGGLRGDMNKHSK